MIAACNKNKVKLAVSYQRRFSSDNPIVKKLIEENKLGKIFSVDLSIKIIEMIIIIIPLITGEHMKLMVGDLLFNKHLIISIYIIGFLECQTKL